MELSFEISQNIRDRLENMIGLTDDEKKEVALLINMAYSNGRVSGYKEGCILTRSIGKNR